MRVPFVKMHGLGNDFVVLDARTEALPPIAPAIAAALADRRTGIGCDQLIVLEPSTVADLRMRIWNSDGGEVESCGNASRCVVALTGATRIETDGGLVEGGGGDEVEVGIAEPRFGWDDIPLAYAMDTAALPMAWDGLEHPMAVNVGNPHLVFFVRDAREVPLETLGPRIENDPAFPERINVNVATYVHDRLKLRTFERGSGETRACGTGACASAVAAIATRRAQSPVTVDMTGGSLTITWAPGEPIRMRGSATHVFEGELDLEALQ